MRSITHCPACQTQFFVTEEQLNKHDGKVRCGQCLHVFDAKAQFIALAANDEETKIPDAQTSNENPATTANSSTSEWPLIHNALLDDDLPDQKQQPATESKDLTATADKFVIFSEKITDTPIEDADESLSNGYNSETNHSLSEISASDVNKFEFTSQQPSYFDDVVSRTKLKAGKTANKSRRWPWIIGSLLLLLAAGAQSVFFLRNEIAIYYPQFKPYLEKACLQLSCSINLPKQIEFIVIDDSDMQEDIDHPGLMHLSSNLINTGTLNLAYPNLELTLTDVEDKPVLRRIFKPAEYLPANTDIVAGFKAREEIKIKLAITTGDVAVAGYRVFVTY